MSEPAARPTAPGGFTLMEVLVALLIGWITMAAFFHTFAFGSVQVEEQGRRRQALALLDGEMEYWRARFQNADALNPVNPSEAEIRRRDVAAREGMDGGPALSFHVEPELSPLQRDGDLRFQQLKVAVSYRLAGDMDTLALESRMYAR